MIIPVILKAFFIRFCNGDNKLQSLSIERNNGYINSNIYFEWLAEAFIAFPMVIKENNLQVVQLVRTINKFLI